MKQETALATREVVPFWAALMEELTDVARKAKRPKVGAGIHSNFRVKGLGFRAEGLGFRV